jgi:adenine deaminase
MEREPSPRARADFVLLSELESLRIDAVDKKGKKVYGSSLPFVQKAAKPQFPGHFCRSVQL